MMRIIAGKLKNRVVYCPPDKKIRPISARARKMIFDILREELRDARVLDLFAGTGILSIEAISRGADFAELVDTNIRVIMHNAKKFDILGLVRVHKMDAEEFLKKQQGKGGGLYDVIFIDPPWREKEKIRKVLILIDISGILSKDGVVVLKMPAKYKIDVNLQTLYEADARRVGNSKVFFLRRREYHE